MFGDANPTAYDLRFSLFGFPIRVHPGFWILAVILGAHRPPALVVIWVVAVFVSIIVHELGHAFLQRAFGGHPSIILYAFGGLAIAPRLRVEGWRHVLISLAGPCAGFVLAGAIYAGIHALGMPDHPVAARLLLDLWWINIAWGVLNLAPIWPLDGGHVARELLTALLPPSKGIVVSLWLSTIVAGVLAVVLYQQTQSLFNALLFGMLSYQSYQAVVAYGRSRGGW